MITFNADPSNPVIHSRLIVDEEGDLNLELDGIPVLFISCRTGITNLFTLDNFEEEHLKAAGFRVTGNQLHVTSDD